MNDLLNFLLNSLNLLDNKIYDNIKSSLLDNFIHGLQTSNSILDNLPNNTNLHFAKFEGILQFVLITHLKLYIIFLNLT